MRGRRGPEKRISEIAAGTERGVAARGVEGPTDRAAAVEAAVPLGATTHHCATGGSRTSL
ncbi:hypothetical protein AB0D46_37095 [Streptomyces sp. NPDC048383]|uniref:hypothetical protein n=1 Tax=Streptomyces sp. NPDC048383 TaxID=3155386 RepID=UPI003428BF9E